VIEVAHTGIDGVMVWVKSTQRSHVVMEMRRAGRGPHAGAPMPFGTTTAGVQSARA